MTPGGSGGTAALRLVDRTAAIPRLRLSRRPIDVEQSRTALASGPSESTLRASIGAVRRQSAKLRVRFASRSPSGGELPAASRTVMIQSNLFNVAASSESKSNGRPYVHGFSGLVYIS